jgi:hypothetical protein
VVNFCSDIHSPNPKIPILKKEKVELANFSTHFLGGFV